MKTKLKKSIQFSLLALLTASSDAFCNNLWQDSAFILDSTNSDFIGIDIKKIQEKFEKEGYLNPGNIFLIDPYAEKNEVDLTDLENQTITIELEELEQLSVAPPNWGY